MSLSAMSSSSSSASISRQPDGSAEGRPCRAGRRSPGSVTALWRAYRRVSSTLATVGKSAAPVDRDRQLEQAVGVAGWEQLELGLVGGHERLGPGAELEQLAL